MTTQHTRAALATTTCLTFGLAAAVAVGAVPQVSGSTDASRVVTAAAPAPALGHFRHHQAPGAGAHHAAPHARRTAHVRQQGKSSASAGPSASTRAGTPASGLVSTLTVQPVAATTTSTEAANIKHAAAHHKKKHHKKRHHHKKHHRATTAPAQPTTAPRTTPSAAAISSAVSGLRNYVHTPFTPTSSQVAEFGDEVCGAFDQNETFAHVKAVILQKVQQLPFTTVSAGAADYVVKTAVALYCPGYKSKVS